jgi:cytoskeleton protein RodZ
LADRIASVEQLVSAREARGLSPDDVVRYLKLAPRQVQALESGDWSSLPGTAFVRGTLKSYGRMIGADVEPLLETVGSRTRAADLRPASSLDEPMPRGSMLGFGSGGSGSRLAWALLLLAGLVALALFFGRGADLSSMPSWLSRPDAAPAPKGADGGEAAKDAAPGKAPEGTTTETVPVPGLPAVAPKDGDPGAPAVPAGAAPPAAPGAAPPVAPTGPSGSAAPGAASASTRAPAALSLRLSFGRDAWVEARQPDGTVLLSGVQKADSVQALSAAGPVSLVIGNAEHARLEVDGKPVDLAPHVRGSVARLTLP